MRIVFMGTPAAAVPTLRRCVDDGHEVVAVWTQPDRPAGRGHKIAFSPVKEFALQHNLPVHQPTKLKTDESKLLFASHQADVAIVVAYGRILPAEFLTTPRKGCINVHFSLLPLYRGASPVNWAIANGDAQTGVTTMFIEPTLDTGPILMQRSTAIHERETATELMARLSEDRAELLSQTLSQLDQITPRKPDDSEATFAPILTKEGGLINWHQTAQEIDQRIRAFQPWPNAHTTYNAAGFAKGLTIWSAESAVPSTEGVAGEVLVCRGDELVVKCGGDTVLRLVEVQPEAKRRMSARDFLN